MHHIKLDISPSSVYIYFDISPKSIFKFCDFIKRENFFDLSISSVYILTQVLFLVNVNYKRKVLNSNGQMFYQYQQNKQSPLIEHRKITWNMTFEIHVLVWDRHKNVTELNQLNLFWKHYIKEKKAMSIFIIMKVLRQPGDKCCIYFLWDVWYITCICIYR